uniref:Uncharacterized protein n=1 Tax=uncultured prokaryote TaxID=198431 RepID=A0A0H5Q5R3_9ZZZZ|nr:hypothetical protein [uncultured prokaryote]
MPAIFTQVVLHTLDAIPANYITNTFSCDVASDFAITDWHTELAARYDAIHSVFSPNVAQLNHEIISYGRTDPEPRIPLKRTVFSFATATSGVPMPSEAALCLSFQAGKVSGGNQARRRGRVYLGPFSSTYLGGDGRPSSGLITIIKDFGDDLLAASIASDPVFTWQVYSTVNESSVDVTEGWVDNAWDTQRRRGLEPSSRSVFPS